MAKNNDQGTGKHPHKSSEEPFPHHEGESEKGKRGAQVSAGSAKDGGGRESQGESGSSDLKEREYRDAQGNIHHHTRTYQEQHGKDK
jgi:hypothetical protein